MFRILVVDDDKNTRRYMQAVLEEAHYTVTTAENGVQALDILGREHIDLIVLDIMMPEMDGYTLTKELRDVQDTIPILMVSAKQLPADKKKEFLLLYKLLSYPGQIFTRIQLMDEIWGMDSDTGWETVTVHIGRLRKRFEGWDEFEIVSVRGLGYKAVRKV